MRRILYCPRCECEATDESCPHWDYEYDPRYFLTAKDLARRQADYDAERERDARRVPAWFAENG
jgi:hypothetical protein